MHFKALERAMCAHIHSACGIAQDAINLSAISIWVEDISSVSIQ